MSKTYNIPKQMVLNAWKEVKENQGGTGVDGVTIAKFDENLKDNLYKIWNRMTSGSYFPPPVKRVEIPKKDGSQRMLGVPTVSDRVAQTVAAGVLNKILDPIFLPDSFGYRPGKSALGAVDVTRKRCWQTGWVIEFDIRALFDNISHELLLRALRKHTQEAWVLLYVERWLRAPTLLPNGDVVERTKGTPQGGCISPVLANLFMHYCFDLWMKREFPHQKWCRYADDGLVHCQSSSQAEHVLACLEKRLSECGLELHREKTKIVRCDLKGKISKQADTKFTFLGYEFRRRSARNAKTGEIFTTFSPAICPKALKAIRAEVRETIAKLGSHVPLTRISQVLNPKVRGWFNYYGRFNRSSLTQLSLYINHRLMIWARNKYSNLFGRRLVRWKWLQERFRDNPKMFVHWEFPVCSR